MLDGLRERGSGHRQAQPLADLAGRFRFNTTLLGMLSDGLSPGDWFRREGSGAPAIWVLGHVAAMRLYLLRTVGIDAPERDWETSFAGAGPTAPVPETTAGPYPNVDELLDTIFESDELLGEALAALSPKDVDEVWADDGVDEVSVGDSVGFFYFDETYHLGQLGLLRQILGKRRVV